MSKRIENAVILDGPAAAMLSQAAHLDDLRITMRGRDERLHSLLVDIAITSAAWRSSRAGKRPAMTEETGEPEGEPRSTPADIARQIGVHARTVRNDINRGALPAERIGRIWCITASDAATYIESRKHA